MGFVKIGDPIKISNIIKDDEPAICPHCNQPMTTIFINEDDNVEIVCKCKQSELEQLD
jgi:hypothetical protein